MVTFGSASECSAEWDLWPLVRASLKSEVLMIGIGFELLGGRMIRNQRKQWRRIFQVGSI